MAGYLAKGVNLTPLRALQLLRDPLGPPFSLQGRICCNQAEVGPSVQRAICCWIGRCLVGQWFLDMMKLRIFAERKGKRPGEEDLEEKALREKKMVLRAQKGARVC
ncbi:uncharacterized protein PGTG_08375 [Puccinia graminis f. sp. tritici CRL 75-36-700-3]|uniref:Uncharacterized protein n=1 Tax=Puccinia graminis f. sp. tritici (strain CRL 75-36-700-3 / race SCCL) TaxID=418459 RepID=E3KDI2_PUCGT|nr:uncharacterized protein PGTG_08375 [Puccinia graminis f. sp. tritici CRL 75-36-700-3]EFP82419.1 hypothetical protein PGTG_08375 [Puccinia graminis f. sp. tritici CRL 75-36-700-3]